MCRSFQYQHNPDDNNFTPILDLVNRDGIPTGIKRKYVKVRIKNTGGASAIKCKAELRVLRTVGNNTEQRHPSDTKILCWDSEQIKYMNIGKKPDNELLHIAFADSNFEQLHLAGDLDIYALSSTKESLYPTAPFRRAQDAFGIGDFEVDLNVTGDDASTKKRMILHVERNYERLRIDIIPDSMPMRQKIIPRIKALMHFESK